MLLTFKIVRIISELILVASPTNWQCIRGRGLDCKVTKGVWREKKICERIYKYRKVEKDERDEESCNRE